MMTILPEFQQVEGKNAFVKNHPVPPFEKDAWKKTLSLAEQWGHYEGAYAKSVGLLDERSGPGKGTLRQSPVSGAEGQ